MIVSFITTAPMGDEHHVLRDGAAALEGGRPWPARGAVSRQSAAWRGLPARRRFYSRRRPAFPRAWSRRSRTAAAFGTSQRQRPAGDVPRRGRAAGPAYLPHQLSLEERAPPQGLRLYCDAPYDHTRTDGPAGVSEGRIRHAEHFDLTVPGLETLVATTSRGLLAGRGRWSERDGVEARAAECGASSTHNTATRPRRSRGRRDVYELCSTSCAGWRPSTPRAAESRPAVGAEPCQAGKFSPPQRVLPATRARLGARAWVSGMRGHSQPEGSDDPAFAFVPSQDRRSGHLDALRGRRARPGGHARHVESGRTHHNLRTIPPSRCGLGAPAAAGGARRSTCRCPTSPP